MKHAIYIFLIFSSGCASTRQITNLSPYLPAKEICSQHRSVDSLLKQYFTAKAYRAIKNIPLIDGPAPSGYASGVGFWSNLASFLTFNGVGRKVIIPMDLLGKWGYTCVIHEYIHHLDDIDRDGDGEWIDHEEFKKAYSLMSKDMKWKGIVYWVEARANSWFTDIFGIGKTSEHIAYVAQQLILINGPDYMRYVFRHILKLSYNKETTMTTTSGRKLKIVLE